MDPKDECTCERGRGLSFRQLLLIAMVPTLPVIIDGVLRFAR